MKNNKKVVMVVAFNGFKDQEYFVPKKVLEDSGTEVVTSSNKIGQAFGCDGEETKVDIIVPNINPLEFDAVIFVGGPGCLENLDNIDSYNLIKDTVSKNKILAAICISPVILAKSGVLKYKNATVWSTGSDKSAIKILEENGAVYKLEPVVQDGKIITANGPKAAEEFGETILKILIKTL